MVYLLDANIFIQAKNLHYGFDFCPAFWDWLVNENAIGHVFSVEKVGMELMAGGDQLANWATARGPGFFLTPDASTSAALSTVSTWVTSQQYLQAAMSSFLQDPDYYVIAQALALGYCVITHEQPSNSIKKVKIPNPCSALGISCLSPYEMLRREGARFVLPTQ